MPWDEHLGPFTGQSCYYCRHFNYPGPNFPLQVRQELGFAFQTHTGSQASSRGEAKDSALPSSPDRYLLEPTERPKESQASCGVWRDIFRRSFPSEGFPGGLDGKESACQCSRHGFDPWVGKIPRASERLSLCATATEPMCCTL